MACLMQVSCYMIHTNYIILIAKNFKKYRNTLKKHMEEYNSSKFIEFLHYTVDYLLKILITNC